MTDCPNAEIRDQLPDLLHGHLDDRSKARVEAHLRECAACREEFELLRAVREAVPRVGVDAARIVSALPAPRRRGGWNRRVWQIAAGVVFLAGTGSAVVRYMGHTRMATPATSVVASGGDSAEGTDVELSVGYGYSDLTDAQLQALLQDVEQLTAVPLSEPDVAIPSVTVTGGGL